MFQPPVRRTPLILPLGAVLRPNGMPWASGGGGTAWTPLRLPSLQRWWRAGINLVGSPVTSWVDVKNGANLVPGNSPARVVLTANGVGYDVPDFDGTNDALTIAGSTSHYNYLHNGLGGWSATVLAVDALSGQRAILSTGDDQITERGAYEGVDGAGGFDLRITNGAGVGYVITIDVGALPADGTPHVIFWQFGTAATPDCVVYIDGTQVATADVVQAASASDATNAISIGARNAGADRPFSGKIAEKLLGNALLTAGEIANLHNYLLGKWL